MVKKIVSILDDYKQRLNEIEEELKTLNLTLSVVINKPIKKYLKNKYEFLTYEKKQLEILISNIERI